LSPGKPKFGMLRNHRGFVTPRVLAVVIVLVLMLIAPIYLQSRSKPARVAPPAQSAASTAPPQVASPGAASAVASPDRLGLSFGHGRTPDNPNQLMYSSCSGEPSPLGGPEAGPCNAALGDTSCRTALPLLCIQKDGSSAEALGLGGDLQPAWVGGTLGATAPVAGFVLGSLAEAHARCAKELGEGWRAAEFDDANANGGLVGKRGAGLSTANTRHWVATKRQKANCWDPS
jgi:hypothetical protein